MTSNVVDRYDDGGGIIDGDGDHIEHDFGDDNADDGDCDRDNNIHHSHW